MHRKPRPLNYKLVWTVVAVCCLLWFGLVAMGLVCVESDTGNIYEPGPCGQTPGWFLWLMLAMLALGIIVGVGICLFLAKMQMEQRQAELFPANAGGGIDMIPAASPPPPLVVPLMPPPLPAFAPPLDTTSV